MITIGRMENVISAQEAEWLLELARSALEKAVSQNPTPEQKRFYLSKAFQEVHGVFVTLWNGAVMRGCIGTPFPGKTLNEAVQELVVRAALHDPRFTPVTTEELPSIRIEISILTPLTPIRPDQIVLGVHGLFINYEKSSGLYFPQVPIEEGWDLKTFLDELCLKAGLSSNSWQEGADLFAFEMQNIRGSCKTPGHGKNDDFGPV